MSGVPVKYILQELTVHIFPPANIVPAPAGNIPTLLIPLMKKVLPVP